MNEEEEIVRLPDYVVSGIAVFRYIQPRFLALTDLEIRALYRQWSTMEASASWLGVTPVGARKFCEWAFTSPASFIHPGA
jgi:hypothetical protein